MFKYINCIDANSQYCPCELAEAGECLACSHLDGGMFCECTKYSGLCIYQEFVWNGNKARETRFYKEYTIDEKEWLRDDILLLKIGVDEFLAKELSRFGAFVFLKCPGASDNHGTPISIIDTDPIRNEIVVALKVAGIKTKALAGCKNTIMVKGPFWNGILGQKYLENLIGDNCIILGRGIGLAPAIMAAKKLKENNKQVFAFLEMGRSDKNYFESYFTNLKCNTISLRLASRDDKLNEDGIREVLQCIEKNNIKTVLSAGNDTFHKNVINYLHKKNNGLNFATVNNSTMCCGEGNCGSCIICVGDKTKVKACKVQYNPLEYFLEGQEFQ